ncbi:hypothetical protein BDA96_06G201400 [Sorghum bicolor]|uniref:RING-type domain-containing protein n=2 Tax=Sorghum bicolor TaxID=4558 RepID=A0A921UE02_SORBI|nr:RING-H2 finger protein ATL39 [Sorghum bicolor]KAG0527081.1 hypothetical protein BDA96_06G201400 [Sorghum bicolor]KXG26945.1 hypothetical protein SORBI_3006G184500 [Sorghum bicolor]|eukprot:XP_021319626.1 RING-H2 finger protein ATL39 [Sorghum bicolor]
MFGSGLNLVSAALGFGMTAAFAAFVCVRFICCRERRGDTRASPSPDLVAELDGSIEHTRTGLEPLVIAAIPTMMYNCEAFSSKDDVQCSICLGEYREKEILRIIPTCRHNFHLACLDLWLQKQTTCPICRVSLKELQAAMPSARSGPQLPADPENSDNPAPQCFLPARQDRRGQNHSHEARGSVEVVIEIRR